MIRSELSDAGNWEQDEEEGEEEEEEDDEDHAVNL